MAHHATHDIRPFFYRLSLGIFQRITLANHTLRIEPQGRRFTGRGGGGRRKVHVRRLTADSCAHLLCLSRAHERPKQLVGSKKVRRSLTTRGAESERATYFS